MPTCDNRFLEVLFFDRDAAGGVHVTQDAILGPDEVRVWIEARVQEGNGNTGNGVSSSAWREVRLRASMALSTAS